MIGVGVEAHDLVLIYIGEVYRHMLIDEVDLLKGHLTRSYLEKCARCAPPAEAILTEEAGEFVGKACSSCSRCGLLRGISLRSFFADTYPCEANLMVT